MFDIKNRVIFVSDKTGS